METTLEYEGAIKDQSMLLAFRFEFYPNCFVIKRNMADSTACKICVAAKDDWKHACVWALMDEDVIERMDMLQFGDPKEWVFHICCNIPEEDNIKILVTA